MPVEAASEHPSGEAAVPLAIPKRRGVPLIPASFFGIVLGLAGLANSWRVAHAAWGAPAAIGEAIFAIAACAWLVVTGLYGWKWIGATGEARAEAAHPVHCCFIGLAGAATLVMALGALPYTRGGAVSLFVLGAGFTIGFGVWRTGQLWRGERAVEATTPVLYLPIVAGGFVTAITAGALGWHGAAALAFGGAFFHRLYTAAVLPPALRPTLGILLAPPAVGALAYLATGAPPTGILVQALLGYALLQGLMLLRMWRWITEQPFAPSYWAVTFGVTALPTAVIRTSAGLPGHDFEGLGVALFLISNAIVAVITVRTVGLWSRRGLGSR
jgi:tellurite resistance protein